MPGLERIGVYVWPWGTTPTSVDGIAEQASYAEQFGFDSVHIGYHTTLPATWIYAQLGNRSIVDQLVVLPVIVERTKRLRVALNAAPLPSRHPFLWAQYLATLDAHSGGRIIAGVAPGWWADDFRIGGSNLTERGARMDEALHVLTRLWAGETIAAPGRFWDASGLELDPLPTQQPLPLWIGGSERSIKRAARHGSAWTPLFPSPDALRSLRARLDEAAARHGRTVELAVITCAAVSDDPHHLQTEMRPRLLEVASFEDPNEKAETSVIYGTAASCAEQVSRLFDAGANYVVLDFQLFGLDSPASALEQMARFADAWPT